MRAAVLTAPGRMEIVEIPRPEPGPNGVRVRLEGCGICASGLPLWEGRPWFTYPLEPGAPGHEAWGRIDRVGARVEAFAPGQRVALLSYHSFAEYDIADADSLIRLPPALDSRPFPGEPLGCACNVFGRSGIRSGQTVGIVGIGFLGALLARLAAGAGARVIAVSRRAAALETVRTLPGCVTLAFDGSDRAAGQVRDIAGEGCDVVIEAAGSQPTLDLASAITRTRGRLVIAGYHQDGPRRVDLQQWNWKGLDVINAHERDPKEYLAGMRAAVERQIAGTLDAAGLYTHTYRLEELDRGFRDLRERPDGFMKGLVIHV